MRDGDVRDAHGDDASGVAGGEDGAVDGPEDLVDARDGEKDVVVADADGPLGFVD
jgi:hypothetical protein